jgi:selenocysteine lyase/cysteine desulfurase
LESLDSALLLQTLVQNGIVASNRFDGLRISFHVYNTLEDVNVVAEVLKKNLHLMATASATVARYD